MAPEFMRARRPHRRAARFAPAVACVLLFIIMTTCAREVAAVDVMGAALAEEEESDAALLAVADSLPPSPLATNAATTTAAKERPLPKINARQQVALDAVNKQSDHLADVLLKHAEEKQEEKGSVDEDEEPDTPHRDNENTLLQDKLDTERPMLGLELSPTQLEAIGLMTSPPLDVEKEEGDMKKEQAKPKDDINATNTGKEAPLKDVEDKSIIPNALTSTSEDEKEDVTAAAAANVSIDHVEAHLHILQQLELSVAQSIEEMNAKVNSRYAKPSGESMRISQELQVLKVNLFVLFILLH